MPAAGSRNGGELAALGPLLAVPTISHSRLGPQTAVCDGTNCAKSGILHKLLIL